MKCILGTAFIMVTSVNSEKSISSGINYSPPLFFPQLDLATRSAPILECPSHRKSALDSRRHLFDLSHDTQAAWFDRCNHRSRGSPSPVQPAFGTINRSPRLRIVLFLWFRCSLHGSTDFNEEEMQSNHLDVDIPCPPCSLLNALFGNHFLRLGPFISVSDNGEAPNEKKELPHQNSPLGSYPSLFMVSS